MNLKHFFNYITLIVSFVGLLCYTLTENRKEIMVLKSNFTDGLKIQTFFSK